MRLIDADELIVIEYGGIKFVPKEFIDEAPTVDAVPVVRCKDCTYYKESYEGVFCSSTGAGMPEDGYCSDGERKDEDDETD